MKDVDVHHSKVEEIVKQQFWSLSIANYLMHVNPIVPAPALKAVPIKDLDLPPTVDGKRTKESSL